VAVEEIASSKPGKGEQERGSTSSKNRIRILNVFGSSSNKKAHLGINKRLSYPSLSINERQELKNQFNAPQGLLKNNSIKRMSRTYCYSCTIHKLLRNSIDINAVKQNPAWEVPTEIVSLSATVPAVGHLSMWETGKNLG
jgi:hypothetical protein